MTFIPCSASKRSPSSARGAATWQAPRFVALWSLGSSASNEVRSATWSRWATVPLSFASIAGPVGGCTPRATAYVTPLAFAWWFSPYRFSLYKFSLYIWSDGSADAVRPESVAQANRGGGGGQSGAPRHASWHAAERMPARAHGLGHRGWRRDLMRSLAPRLAALIGSDRSYPAWQMAHGSNAGVFLHSPAQRRRVQGGIPQCQHRGVGRTDGDRAPGHFERGHV